VKVIGKSAGFPSRYSFPIPGRLLPRLSRWSLKYAGTSLRGAGRTSRFDMVIAYNGDVVLCCEDMARKVILGNVRDTPPGGMELGKGTEVLGQIYQGHPSSDDFICKSWEFGEHDRPPARQEHGQHLPPDRQVHPGRTPHCRQEGTKSLTCGRSSTRSGPTGSAGRSPGSCSNAGK
jgi:hypothetical protein